MFGTPIKRAFDVIIASAGLFLILPLLVFLSVVVYTAMGRPVFFGQFRPGIRGEMFCLYKFRTMKDSYGRDGNLLPDAERMTPAGSRIRKWSLDELPELWNVLKGDMSLVGPRPLLPQYLGRYSPEQARRHEVKPGITGWAQVNGRNAITWEEKFKLDVWYVDNASFLLDLKILWMTLAKVFRREGISQEGQATMEEFMGSGKPRGE